MRKSSLLFIVIFIGLFLFLVSANEFSDTIQGDFDNGTYNWTFYNTSGFVQLNSSRLNGTFTSQVFNAGSSSVWNNISWTSGGIGELPNSQLDEINTNTWPSTNINMTGNVLLMHMNEASGTIVDYSRTGNNGTAVGGPTYGVAGKFNTAMSFEGGNEGISLSNDVSLNPSAAMTVSAWIYIDTGNTQYGSILTRWNNGNAYYIGTLPNSYAVVIYFSGSLRYTTPALPTGEWVHFLVTNNGAGNTVSYYQNGAYVGGGASGGAIASSTSVSSIGYDVQRVNYPFKGDIDEFAIWNRTLSTTEILDVYKRGAERLNLSVQSCDDAACSGESFTNSGANLTSPYTLPIADNTFFQYKFEFETDNVSYSPELYNVTMGYTLLDTTAPEITLANLSDGYNTSSQDLTFNFTAVENYPQDMNCSLYIDSSFIMGNTTVQNNTLTNLNASSIAEGTHLWNVTCLDGAGNQNWSATRTFTVDLSAPSITSIVYSPNASGEVDPSTNLVFNATVSDDVVSVSEVILQYYNGTGWANSTMTNNSATNYNATITSISTETNYTFNIWANDTFGNSNSSANQTFDSIWDCTWSATSDLGQVAGFDENKWAGNITINNTGDATYASSNCSLDFRLTHDLSEGRIYYDGSYYKPSSTYTLVAKSNTTIEINATFQDEVIEESAIITINEISSRSSTSSRNTTATLVSTTGGPYLFQTITSNPSLLDLTFQNFSLNAYVRNLVGDDTVNNTAYNVSFNWSLPNNFLVKDGNSSLSYGNISDNTLIYNNINVSFNSTNLPNLSPGTISINLYAQGFNSSGTVITHAGNITLLTKQINISLSCYSTSDGVYVTACGSLDPDQPEESTAAAGAAGGGGGGGGGGTSKTESVKTNAGFQLVRGKENEVEVAFENSDKNESITDIEFSIEGKIAKYIEISPKTFSVLAPGQEVAVTLKITSPTYIELGRQELTITMKGKKGDKDYINKKTVVLEIHELSGEEAKNLLEESEQLIKQYNEQRYCGEILCSPSLLPDIPLLIELLKKSKESIEEFGYETVRDNYEIIEKGVTNALKAKEIIEELDALILVSDEKKIDTSGSQRISKLARLSLERGDFEQAYLRAKEAQNTYALEVKGELASIGYYLSHNKKEISLASAFLLLFSFVTYKVSKLQSLKRKIKNLREEENILAELMKVVQNETFKEGRMSMDEYREAMDQYEDRLSKTIEKLIELETKRAYALKFTSKQKKLKIERERVIELVKGLQKSYLQEGTMETRSYELRLKSYNKRLSEIDQMFATLEAKSAMKDGGAGLFDEGGEVKVEVKDKGSGLVKERKKVKVKVKESKKKVKKKRGRNGK